MSKAWNPWLFAVMTLVIVLPALVTGIHAQHPSSKVNIDTAELFELANEAYRESRYLDAITKYDEIRRRDSDSTVLFNLGNAWFRFHQTAEEKAEGALGRAIGFYERVLRIDPRHRDARANLRHARTLVHDAIDEPDVGGLSRILCWPTLDELVVVTLILLWVTCSIFMIRRRSRREVLSEILFWLLFILVPLVLLSGGWTAGRIVIDSGRDQAVILARQVAVRSAPQEGATTVFSLHEGTVVSVVRESRGWLQVSLPNGFAGWIRHEISMRID